MIKDIVRHISFVMRGSTTCAGGTPGVFSSVATTIWTVPILPSKIYKIENVNVYLFTGINTTNNIFSLTPYKPDIVVQGINETNNIDFVLNDYGNPIDWSYEGIVSNPNKNFVIGDISNYNFNSGLPGGLVMDGTTNAVNVPSSYQNLITRLPAVSFSNHKSDNLSLLYDSPINVSDFYISNQNYSRLMFSLSPGNPYGLTNPNTQNLRINLSFDLIQLSSNI
jgi:hypothetical protein